MSYRILGAFILLLGSVIRSSAQNSSPLKPQWVGNVPCNYASDFYFVEVHSDMGSSLSGARTSVMQELSAGVERTDKVSVREIYEDSSTQQYSSDRIHGYSSDFYQLELQVDGESQPIRSRRIDEYWKTSFRGGSKIYEYYALYAVERQGHHADFSIISTTSSYGARGLWRSAIIPGWGQFHKGANLKGGLILGGCAALAAGIVDHFATARNICIGAAAALYVYNLIDAIAAPGARRIAVRRRNSNGQTYSFVPAVMPDGSAGMVAAVTF